jgi:hypothetical protein
MRPDSDLDLLVVAQPLPQGRLARMDEFDAVEVLVAPALVTARGRSVSTRLSPIVRTLEELDQGGFLIFDIACDGQVVFDADGSVANYLAQVRQLLERRGARRETASGDRYWALEPMSPRVMWWPMTGDQLAHAYLVKARARRRVLEVLTEEQAWPDVVRYAQELVELALTGALRVIGIDPPKWHDVGSPTASGTRPGLPPTPWRSTGPSNSSWPIECGLRMTDPLQDWHQRFQEAARRQQFLLERGAWRAVPQSLLGVIGRQHLEQTHSAALAWLLDPNARHELGTKMLERFLGRSGLPTERAAAGTLVATETICCSRDHGSSGFVDVLVTGGAWSLPIENKLWAGQSGGQLEVYFDAYSAVGADFVYLTPERGEGSQHAARGRCGLPPGQLATSGHA